MTTKYLLGGVRFFVFQSKDMATMPELQAGYSTSILIDEVGMNRNLIRVQSCYPFKKYYDQFQVDFSLYPEDCYVFFLENFYHSSSFALWEAEFILSRLYTNKKVYIHSSKLKADEARDLMSRYPNIHMIILTDIEYVLHTELVQRKDISSIENIIYRNEDWIIDQLTDSKVEYPLKDILPPAYTNGKILEEKDNVSYIASFIEDDGVYTDSRSFYNRPREQQVENLYRQEAHKSAMLCTGRGCKYKCSYCFRGVKYSVIRQIPLDVVEADIEYLRRAGIKRIYFYDDCFITTNKDRLDEVVAMMKKFPDVSYYIAIRYEACTPEILEKFIGITFYNVQIGLQSIKHNSAHLRSFNNDKLISTIESMRKYSRGSFISIDLILGLPGETVDEFKESFKYALSLRPNGIVVNTLFVNPGTKLAETYETFGIKTKKVALNVPYIVESNTISANELEDCKNWLKDMTTIYPEISFILR